MSKTFTKCSVCAPNSTTLIRPKYTCPKCRSNPLCSMTCYKIHNSLCTGSVDSILPISEYTQHHFHKDYCILHSTKSDINSSTKSGKSILDSRQIYTAKLIQILHSNDIRLVQSPFQSAPHFFHRLKKRKNKSSDNDRLMCDIGIVKLPNHEVKETKRFNLLNTSLKDIYKVFNCSTDQLFLRVQGSERKELGEESIRTESLNNCTEEENIKNEDSIDTSSINSIDHCTNDVKDSLVKVIYDKGYKFERIDTTDENIMLKTILSGKLIVDLIVIGTMA